ncbi:MAG: metallophosphoesterase, partial [Bacteroidales bacterium]|nr:metallophosphoesterase [Bacteroidales bacterium]
RVIAGGDTSTTHYFKTGGTKEWSACIISDFHVYSPLYGRTKAAMEMIETIKKAEPGFDFILHLGDITAWGGSYSFWQNLYTEKPFEDYMWAGVNGNHDNMTRGYHRTTNEFFRDAAAYPHNGYGNEMGVCYFFKHGDVLFIMLNNESMKTDEGLKEAQDWVRKVVNENPSGYKIVCEHYQWFYGETGKTSQFGRWNELFDELGIDLALGANNHIYVSTHPISSSQPQTSSKPVSISQPQTSCKPVSISQPQTSSKPVSISQPQTSSKPQTYGTVYIQTTSSDNERGVECDLAKPLEFNADKIKFRWSEGAQTVSGMYMKVSKKKLTLVLLNRHGKVLDTTEIRAKR